MKSESKEIITNTELNKLADTIVVLIAENKQKLSKQINNTLVETYWKIGKYIVEFEQNGNAKAVYGTALLTNLSKLLSAKIGKGFSRPNLNCMRKFFLLYDSQICQTLSDKLSWSHICELITIDNELERKFYEKECIAQKWDVRYLRRQMESGLYLRLAASKDKQGIIELSQKVIIIQKTADIFRDTYTLEFLGLPEKKQYSEKTLEKRLIKNLQNFLLELGKGFAFVGEQYSLLINNRRYHIDLVFYHIILKCYVLIDLKKNAVKHQDIGQMNMYLGYFAKEKNNESDNPPIGIILSHIKDDLMVEYATYGMDSNLFVSKYELYLPNKEELRKLITETINEK